MIVSPFYCLLAVFIQVVDYGRYEIVGGFILYFKCTHSVYTDITHASHLQGVESIRGEGFSSLLLQSA